MKTASNRRGTNAVDGCCCHLHSRKPIFAGLMLLLIGWALNSNYSVPEVLMLVGGILVVKGVLVISAEKKK